MLNLVGRTFWNKLTNRPEIGPGWVFYSTAAQPNILHYQFIIEYIFDVPTHSFPPPSTVIPFNAFDVFF